LPAPQEPAYTPLPDPGNSPAPFGSGLSLQQREAALFTVNAELDRLPYILPMKEDAPTRDAVLKIASDRNAAARKKFGPEDLSAYSRTVVWTLRFDDQRPDPEKARQYSLLVTAATNHFSEPYFIMALASAVFSLDPQSTTNANNFASAVLAGGERLHPDASGIKDLAPYRNEAELIYRYALAIPMKDDAWGDESFTTILNLGYLYIDMGKPEEARSLFQVARKLKPYSWDAAKAMAAYFHAIGQPDKALTILEDPKLDKPMMLMVAKKSAKILEKSEPYAELPADTPAEKFAEGIKVMSAEPIATSADFVAQIDQSERNKMRYFVEHLPPEGSYSAPKINKLTQYSTNQVINSPHGRSARNEFGNMIQSFAVSSNASIGKEQLKMLSRLGMDLKLGIDLDDVARHPEKYTNQKGKKKSKATFDKSKFKENIAKLKMQAEQGKRELATGKTGTLTEIAAQVKPFNAIVAMNPEEYADPMNIIIQKHNYSVHNRKTNLYTGYLYAENKKILQAVRDIQQRYHSTMEELKNKQSGGDGHEAHVEFFNAANAAGATAFGSATNVTSYAYVNKIKPMAEAYYYDVIRHVGLISDPEVRDAMEAELRRNINSALVQALSTVLAAHASFRHYDNWDCSCSDESFSQARAAEREAFESAEEERIARYKAGKAVFDSKDIPESTPLWKKLDAYGTDLNIPGVFFLSGRISCARTVVTLNTKILPIPKLPELFGSMTVNEFTGASKYEGGVTYKVLDMKGKDFAPGSSVSKLNINIGLNTSISTDGNWHVSDYSVTPKGEVTVEVGKTTFTTKGRVTVGSGGTSAGGEVSVERGNTTVTGGASVNSDGSVTTSGEVSVKHENTGFDGTTSVTVKGQVTFGPNGDIRDSDFSAGINQDMKNGFGSSGNASFEASTKRGCTLSGSVTGSVMPSDASGKDVDKSALESIKDEEGNVIKGAFAEKPVTDKFHQKTLWSGKFCTKKEECGN
ncbi:MAG: hypothetical protein HGB35_01935, partial [Geobacteraceae bacterium]|nr:hypothetical protein [Geobacteraceae bacterium]